MFRAVKVGAKNFSIGLLQVDWCRTVSVKKVESKLAIAKKALRHLAAIRVVLLR